MLPPKSFSYEIMQRKVEKTPLERKQLKVSTVWKIQQEQTFEVVKFPPSFFFFLISFFFLFDKR